MEQVWMYIQYVFTQRKFDDNLIGMIYFHVLLKKHCKLVASQSEDKSSWKKQDLAFNAKSSIIWIDWNYFTF